MDRSPDTHEYGQRVPAVHLYSDPMVHLTAVSQHFFLLLPGTPAPADPEAAYKLVLLSSILLGLVVILLVVLQMAAIRRRTKRRFAQPPPEPDPQPLEQHGIDPWRESARRLDAPVDDELDED